MKNDLNTFNKKLGKGLCLISRPEMLDPSFLMTSTLICEHDSEGSFGLTLNRPSTFFINPSTYELSAENNADYYPVNIGGPVEMDNVFYLFRSTKNITGAKQIRNNLFLSSSKELLKEIREELTPENIKFFIGYAGWSFYQLDCEASSGIWFTHALSEDLIFNSEKISFWLESLREIGPNFYDCGKNFLKNFT